MSDAFQLTKSYTEDDPHVPPPVPVTPPATTFYTSNDIWKGFYSQNGQQSPMTFTMFSAILGGPVSGAGSDGVGTFHISGSVDQSGNVRFVKQYDGKHSVNYTGTLSGDQINGQWELQGMQDAF